MKRIFISLFLISLSYTVFSQRIKLDDYIVEIFIDSTGREITCIIVPGRPPDDFRMPVAESTKSSTILSNVPGYDWSFGCSATSGAMMAGYYDITGYYNMYTGPTNGGVAPLNNSTWGGVWINGEYRKQCPLSATRNGLDGRTTRGHVDDYWIQYGNSSADPWITNGWTQHTWGDCTGDYMGTNQSSFSNTDGSTTFYYYTNGAPLYNYNAPSGYKDGCYGLRAFFESRGYTVIINYNQYIYPYGSNTQGFTFNQYKQEINAGRPVLIQITGHTMLGYGYDDAGQTIYLRDTWDYSQHSMSWGGSYSGMTHYGVVIIQLAGAPYITVSSPNGGENWQQGSTNNIIWLDNISENVKIELYKNASFNSTITSSTASSGSYSWNISSSQTPGSDYKIKITSVNSSGCYDYSDNYFTIGTSVPPTRYVQNVTINNGQSECYDATNNIVVAGSGTTVVIQPGGEATFIAGSKVVFNPGFYAYPGSEVSAFISTGTYCSSLPPMVATTVNDEENCESPDMVINLSPEIKIYPNPSQGQFIIDFVNEDIHAEIYIFNTYGKKVYQAICLEQNRQEVDLSNLPPGMYLIVIKTDNRVLREKLIIN